VPEDVEFTRIDPVSGLLAREGETDAYLEVFRRGTEPTKYASRDTGVKAGQFYMLDQGDGDFSLTKKAQEEVED
jgi:membrane carboxypeptidase/penicillin-binding protein